MQRPEIPTNVRFVMMVLANRADPEGVCWPSVRYIMARTGLGERTVREACKAIAELELMSVEPQQRTDGGKATNKYILCISTPPPAPGAPTPPAVAAGGQVHGVQGVGAPPAPHKTKEETPLPDGKGRARTAKKFPIPDGYTPSAEVMKWTEEHGLLASYVGQQLEAFRDDALANRRLHADWDSALRNWLRNQPRFDRTAPRPTRGGGHGPARESDRRCVWPRRDAIDRCTETAETDRDGSWIGLGNWICSRHVKLHLDRIDERQRSTA